MKPKIFIGSSVEGKYIADAIQANFEYFAWCTIWEHAFLPSNTTIDSLIKDASKHDFAIFVFSDDDLIKIRQQDKKITRDNVIFEAGLFLGELGKDRVFIVKPRDVGDIHILSDLEGFTPVTYESVRAKREGESKPALATAANDIKEAIKESVWSTLKLKIAPKILYTNEPRITFHLKLEFVIQNKHPYPVTIESKDFKLNPSLKFAPNSRDDQHKPLFFRKEKDGSEKYKEQITVESGEKAMSCWIPIDPAIGKEALEKAVTEKKIGSWNYRCIWVKEHVITCTYEDEF